MSYTVQPAISLGCGNSLASEKPAEHWYEMLPFAEFNCETKYCSNTSNLSAHLKRCHGIDGGCPEKKRDSVATSLTPFIPQKFSSTSRKAKNISKAIVLFMCKKFVLLKTKATYRMYLSRDTTYPAVNISERHLFQTCTEKVVRPFGTSFHAGSKRC